MSILKGLQLVNLTALLIFAKIIFDKKNVTKSQLKQVNNRKVLYGMSLDMQKLLLQNYMKQAVVRQVKLAHRYLTYRLPSVLNDPKGVLKEVQKHYKPIRSTILYLCIGQAILASAITYFEANSVFTVNRKLAKLDKPLEFDVI